MHTDELLAELGYDEKQIEDLKSAQIVGGTANLAA